MEIDTKKLISSINGLVFRSLFIIDLVRRVHNFKTSILVKDNDSSLKM